MDSDSRTNLAVLEVPSPESGLGAGTAAWFDATYRSAGAEVRNVPWAIGQAEPALVAWLNSEAQGRVRPGSRAVAVGCGLGDNVAELLNRGYDAIGFDFAPSAIEWARRRFPGQANAFCVADLLNPPSRFRHRFELVLEAYTLQSIDPALREQAAAAIASMCGPRGVVLAIASARPESAALEGVQGPPWPLTCTELSGLFERAGLKPIRATDDFTDESGRGCRLLRCAFERA